MNNEKRKKIKILYTNIGRGHPSYLDGIKETLNQKQANVVILDVFEISSGLSKSLWKLLRFLYRVGSSDSLIGKCYSYVRKKKEISEKSLFIRLLGKSIKEKFEKDQSLLIVGHPILVAILYNHPNLYYQHGELVVPTNMIVGGAKSVFLPTSQAVEEFSKSDYDSKKLIETGLCIEPILVEQATEDVFKMRLSRYKNSKSITGLFISSGAEPQSHIDSIVRSCHSHLASEGSAIIICKKNGRLHLAISNVEKIEKVNNSKLIIACFENREEEVLLTSKYFTEIDFFVSPAHERSNYAFGLGLPMFILLPNYGSFAPLNSDLLLRNNSALTIKTNLEADQFGDMLSLLRKSGKLEQMAKSAWGNYPIDGYDKISEYILKNIHE